GGRSARAPEGRLEYSPHMRWLRPDRPPAGTAARWPARVAPALIGAALAVRIAALLAGLPPTNSDEATVGLMSLHIARGTGFPIFFYGQHYMGALEAYLAAPLFWLVGPSTGATRAQTLVYFAVFLWCMYRLTTLLYTRWFAVAVVGLLAFGSDRLFQDQLIAAGGYPEIRPMAAGRLPIAVVLACR